MADLINLKKLKLALWYVLLAAGALFLQCTVFSRLTFFAVRMLFLPALCVAVGMQEGGWRGGLFGLLCGALGDMAYPENTVLFTILFPLLGFGVGIAAETFLSRRFPAYLAAAEFAVALAGLCQMARVLMLEPGSGLYALWTVLLQALWTLPMAAAVYFPARGIHTRHGA